LENQNKPAGQQGNYADNRKKSAKNQTPDMSNFVFGKVQPQALSLEEAVLGALLIDREAMPIVLDILRAATFYSPAHQAIYRSMEELFRTSKPIDLLTVSEQLRKQGELETIGGSYYLVELTNRVASSANVEYHARIVAQKHIQRELIRVSTGIIQEAYDETTDVFSLMDSAEQNLFAITETNLSRSFEGMGSLTSKFLIQLEELSKKEDGLTGVPSGFTDLDRLTSGWQPSDMIIVAARPSMGKTAFVLSLARNAALDFNKGVAFFSLEMSNLQLVQRLISMEAEIYSSKLRNGQLEPHEWQQLHSAIERMGKAPIYIDDTPGINIFELRAKCRRLKAKHDIQIIIIDYLQLMTGESNGKGGSSGNREQEISGISRALKGLAKELNVPVIALSQLSRAVETRGGNKKPQLSDLRESGAIEQDADIVSFIYRPEYYQITEDEEGNSLKGMADIIVSKHRNGALGEVRLRFVGEYSRFQDPDDTAFGDFGVDTTKPQANIVTRPSKMNDDVPF
jgi:replicative DNA helicase